MIGLSARAALLAGIILVAPGGCERPSASPAPADTPSPATVPVVSDPATLPAASQPVSSIMHLGGQPTIFPPARLRIESDGQRLVALLFSDDPRDALKDNYTGNSYYLRMPLDVSDQEELGQATWQFTAPSGADREDTPYGIYIGGRKAQLTPFQVMGRFRVDEAAGDTVVMLTGQFKLVDETTRRGPPQLISVAAEMPVAVDSDIEKKAVLQDQ